MVKGSHSVERVAEDDTLYRRKETQQALFAQYENDHSSSLRKKNIHSQLKKKKKEEGGTSENPGPGAFSGMCKVRTCKLVSKRNALAAPLPPAEETLPPCGPQASALESCSLKSARFKHSASQDPFPAVWRQFCQHPLCALTFL